MGKVNYDDVRPGRAVAYARYAEARQPLLIQLGAWVLLGVVAAGLSTYTYLAAREAGGIWLIWFGPIVYAIRRSFQVSRELNHLKDDMGLR